MAQETPTILSHNVLEGGDLSNVTYAAGFDPYKMADHLRHTHFKSDTTALIQLKIRAKTLTRNPTMDNSIDNWRLFVESGGSGTWTHNTTTPINGNGDGKLTSSVASKWVRVFSDKIFSLKAGRTYRVMGQFLNVAGAGSVVTHIGFIDPDMGTVRSSTNEGVGIVTNGISDVYTPTADIDVRVFVGIYTVDGVYIDDMIMNEAPAPDTLIIDKGHNLRDAQVRVRGTTDESSSYITMLDWTDILTDGVFYQEIVTTTNYLLFRIDFQFAVDPYEIPTLHLGKRWELPRPFTEPFDNEGSRISFTDTTTLVGINRRQAEFQARQLDARFDFIAAGDYSNIRKFYEDIRGGEIPFWIIPRPTIEPLDILYMKLMNKERRAPEGPNIFRSWGFTAEELTNFRAR